MRACGIGQYRMWLTGSGSVMFVEVLERVGRITDGGLPDRNLCGLLRVRPILPHIPPVLPFISPQKVVPGNHDTAAHGGGHDDNLEHCSLPGSHSHFAP